MELGKCAWKRAQQGRIVSLSRLAFVIRLLCKRSAILTRIIHELSRHFESTLQPPPSPGRHHPPSPTTHPDDHRHGGHEGVKKEEILSLHHRSPIVHYCCVHYAAWARWSDRLTLINLMRSIVRFHRRSYPPTPTWYIVIDTADTGRGRSSLLPPPFFSGGYTYSMVVVLGDQ